MTYHPPGAAPRLRRAVASVPAMSVSPRTLERLAGLIWLAVGALLLWRGAGMLFVRSTASPAGLAAALALGLSIGWLKGTTVLARAARRNRRRIRGLARPRVWNVMTARFALLVAAMIALGLGMRSAAAAGWIGWATVGAVYVGIGAALVASSRTLLRDAPAALATRPEEPPPAGAPPVGVLLVNLGTPDAPTPGAVRAYLREFLSDPDVVELPRWLWIPVLRAFVLPRRSRRVARAYESIWTPEGAPLSVHSARAAEALRSRLGPRFAVELAMRYGNPSLASAVERLAARGCERIVALPLFPQWSRSTSGSVQRAIAGVLAARRAGPALQVVAPYYASAAYVDAVAQLVEQARVGHRIDLFVFSFHGLPEAYVRAGDPYLEHCTRTAWALAGRLRLERSEWELAFQSRFGDEPWLQPYLDELVPARARSHPRILVALPGFAADCLETLDEVGVELRRSFLDAGGEELVVVPALNASSRWIDALEELVAELAPGGGPATPRW